MLAIGFALLALVVMALIALPWLAVRAMRRTCSRESWLRRGHQILSAVLWALLGVAIGTLVQSQVAALVGTLVWIFLGETLLLGLFGVLDVDGLLRLPARQALDAADGSAVTTCSPTGPGLRSRSPRSGRSAPPES